VSVTTHPRPSGQEHGAPAAAAPLLVLAGVLLGSWAPAAVSQQRHIDGARLEATLKELSQFGADRDGGVSRIGFSEADLAGRAYVTALMRAAGLTVRVDAAGNIFGRRPGTASLPLLLFGSHIDSVPHGGNFDGDVGSLGAIEVVRALNDRHIQTRHPLEVVVWANEEGGRFYLGSFGSDAAAGQLPADIAGRTTGGSDRLADWLARMGGDASQLATARITPGRVAGYLELHIEQGAVLEEAKVPIGVVLGIVAINSRRCTATGFANHAGTTPMNRRRDALAAASRAVLAVRQEVRAQPGRQVGTVGWMTVEPGAVNVIPGQVTFTVELRDLDEARLERIAARILSQFELIGREEQVQIRCAAPELSKAALTSPAFRQVIRAAAQQAGLGSIELPSGAGHDAQNVARFAPIGMIFVPSRGGISHSPLEYTAPEDVANGAEVLYRALLRLDAQLDAAKAPR
jgi:beta-ureidopropionase / N-carbamoyl-L-amino-acid hydrolase